MGKTVKRFCSILLLSLALFRVGMVSMHIHHEDAEVALMKNGQQCSVCCIIHTFVEPILFKSLEAPVETVRQLAIIFDCIQIESHSILLYFLRAPPFSF